MKNVSVITLLLALLAIMACSKKVDIEAEKQNVEKVVYDFFDALAAFNYQGLRDLCTDDFILLEWDGQVMSIEEFIKFIEPFEEATLTYEFEDIKTNVEGSVAWISLRNKAVMTMGEQVTNYEWVESAVLKKQDGLWKLALYHSTLAKPPEEK